MRHYLLLDLSNGLLMGSTTPTQRDLLELCKTYGMAKFDAVDAECTLFCCSVAVCNL